MSEPIAPRRTLLMPLLGAAIAAGVVGLLVGAVAYSPREVWAALLDGSTAEGAIIRNLRLPRVLLAFGVGGSLAVAGASLQAVVGNPLAEPWLLGISGGAALGAVLAVVIGLPASWSAATFATIGALAAIAIVYRIALVAGRRVDPRVLVLAGVVTGAFASAISAALLVIADPYTFRAASLWLFGGFGGATWGALLRFGAVAVPALLLIIWLARALDLLALGDATAAALGIDVTATRRRAIFATAMLTAATVATAGIIGFVGLVVPHALRWAVGTLHRRLLPAAFLAGGSFTVLADAAARTVVAPAELPVGVVTALVGVPVFAIVLRRSAS